MNEDIKQEIKEGLEAKKSAETKPVVKINPEIKPVREINLLAKPQQNDQNALMQQVVQSMLPDDLKSSNLKSSSLPPSAPSIPGPTPEAEKLDQKFIQKPIRTYERDLAEAMAKKQTSVASIAIAENKRKEELQRKTAGSVVNVVSAVDKDSAEPKKFYGKQILLGLLSIVFIGGGAMGGYYLYKKSAFAQPYVEPKPIKIPSIIPYDKEIPLSVNEATVGDQLISQIYSQINKEVASPGKILELSTGITASSFIQRTNMNMPDVILRSVTDRWMLGAYTEGDGQKTLFIGLSTDFFQNVFAGMLSWEKSMPDDLSTLFNYKQRTQREDLNASTSISSYFNIQGTFSDKVIRNRDVREFINTNGELLLLYSFINKETLIITTTESALIAGIDSIEKQTYVR